MLGATQLGIKIGEPTVAGIEEALRAAWLAGPDELERLGRNGADHLLENCSWRVRGAEDGRRLPGAFRGRESRRIKRGEDL